MVSPAQPISQYSNFRTTQVLIDLPKSLLSTLEDNCQRDTVYLTPSILMLKFSSACPLRYLYSFRFLLCSSNIYLGILQIDHLFSFLSPYRSACVMSAVIILSRTPHSTKKWQRISQTYVLWNYNTIFHQISTARNSSLRPIKRATYLSWGGRAFPSSITTLGRQLPVLGSHSTVELQHLGGGAEGRQQATEMAARYI